MSVRMRRFYRILAIGTPTALDFTSFHELGQKPGRPLTPEAEQRWRGVSVFDTLENAKAHVGRSAYLGTFAAVMEIGPELGIAARRTGKSKGHWTLWGSADVMLASVTAIIDLNVEGGK